MTVHESQPERSPNETNILFRKKPLKYFLLNTSYGVTMDGYGTIDVWDRGKTSPVLERTLATKSEETYSQIDYNFPQGSAVSLIARKSNPYVVLQMSEVEDNICFQIEGMYDGVKGDLRYIKAYITNFGKQPEYPIMPVAFFNNTNFYLDLYHNIEADSKPIGEYKPMSTSAVRATYHKWQNRPFYKVERLRDDNKLVVWMREKAGTKMKSQIPEVLWDGIQNDLFADKPKEAARNAEILEENAQLMVSIK